MIESIAELPYNVRLCYSDEDAQIWLETYNTSLKSIKEGGLPVPDGMSNETYARQLAFDRCRYLPSSRYVKSIVTAEVVDREGEVADVDGYYDATVKLIDRYGGVGPGGHSSKVVSTVWGVEKGIDPKSNAKALYCCENYFRGEDIYDRAWTSVNDGTMSEKSIGSVIDVSKSKMECNEDRCYTRIYPKHVFEISSVAMGINPNTAIVDANISTKGVHTFILETSITKSMCPVKEKYLNFKNDVVRIVPNAIVHHLPNGMIYFTGGTQITSVANRYFPDYDVSDPIHINLLGEDIQYLVPNVKEKGLRFDSADIARLMSDEVRACRLYQYAMTCLGGIKISEEKAKLIHDTFKEIQEDEEKHYKMLVDAFPDVIRDVEFINTIGKMDIDDRNTSDVIFDGRTSPEQNIMNIIFDLILDESKAIFNYNVWRTDNYTDASAKVSLIKRIRDDEIRHVVMLNKVMEGIADYDRLVADANDELRQITGGDIAIKGCPPGQHEHAGVAGCHDENREHNEVMDTRKNDEVENTIPISDIPTKTLLMNIVRMRERIKDMSDDEKRGFLATNEGKMLIMSYIEVNRRMKTMGDANDVKPVEEDKGCSESDKAVEESKKGIEDTVGSMEAMASLLVKISGNIEVLSTRMAGIENQVDVMSERMNALSSPAGSGDPILDAVKDAVPDAGATPGNPVASGDGNPAKEKESDGDVVPPVADGGESAEVTRDPATERDDGKPAEDKPVGESSDVPAPVDDSGKPVDEGKKDIPSDDGGKEPAGEGEKKNDADTGEGKKDEGEKKEEKKDGKKEDVKKKGVPMNSDEIIEAIKGLSETDRTAVLERIKGCADVQAEVKAVDESVHPGVPTDPTGASVPVADEKMKGEEVIEVDTPRPGVVVDERVKGDALGAMAFDNIYGSTSDFKKVIN